MAMVALGSTGVVLDAQACTDTSLSTAVRATLLWWPQPNSTTHLVALNPQHSVWNHAIFQTCLVSSTHQLVLGETAVTIGHNMSQPECFTLI